MSIDSVRKNSEGKTVIYWPNGATLRLDLNLATKNMLRMTNLVQCAAVYQHINVYFTILVLLFRSKIVIKTYMNIEITILITYCINNFEIAADTKKCYIVTLF